jgi:hypothetical protein
MNNKHLFYLLLVQQYCVSIGFAQPFESSFITRLWDVIWEIDWKDK